ncbi:MAG TPA: 3-oxoacyl-[acyl-carrier-protein] synthase III C-terminal domain-containing protein [Bryobacteraceae bacterium]|nr:3-oxoacyl-[acyl-carrier-protein] synthase III C-terminal domain-containing protein [Bryobacteraceae bacterium]
MNITSVASAFPKHYYPQSVLLSELQKFWGPKLENPAMMDRLYSRIGVEGRYTALPVEQYPGLERWGAANQHWIEISQELGEQALGCALKRAHLEPTGIDALFFVSITGIASPSIDARLINRMGLSTSLKRIPIFGLGCVAGAAGIARAADYVRAFPDQIAAVLSVELCSLTLQHDDVSMANLISAGLFGDGAAAVLVAGAERSMPGPAILATRSFFYPGTEHVMGWDISEKGFQIVLSREVPEVVEQHLAADVDTFLAEQGLTHGDIQTFILHTGGPSVLEAAEHALNLPPGALDVSWACLRRMGNLSSASVLMVLEEVMLHRRPDPGTYSILAAMGPGFCSEFVLLKW